MKRFLLGGTAFAAASVIVAGAKAAEGGVKLGIGGQVDAADQFASKDSGQDDFGYQPRSDTFKVSDEIHLNGEATLDNGLTMGAHVGLTGADDQIDKRWIYLQGGWGELRLGDEDDARKLKSYAAPTPPANRFGGTSPFITFGNSSPGQVVTTVSTLRSASNKSAKLIYFTPSFGGFQIAISYAPGGQEDRTWVGTANTNTCPQIQDALSVGADYSGRFYGVTVAVGGGYTEGQPECNGIGEGDKPQVWAAGLNISYAGLAIGGSIMFADKILGDPTSGRAVDNNIEFDLGAAYVRDVITVEIGWNHGTYDRGGLGTDTLDQARVGASYALGPGISIDAKAGYIHYGCDTCNDNKGWQTSMGLAIVF
jgi:outer membrane protein OmpU